MATKKKKTPHNDLVYVMNEGRRFATLQARATVYAALAALPRTHDQGRDVDSIVRDAVAIVAKLETAS